MINLERLRISRRYRCLYKHYRNGREAYSRQSGDRKILYQEQGVHGREYRISERRLAARLVQVAYAEHRADREYPRDRHGRRVSEQNQYYGEHC